MSFINPLINDLLSISPYSLNKDEKQMYLVEILRLLTKFHYNKCDSYSKIINALNTKIESIQQTSDIPFIPVSLFKEYDLKSIKKESVVKTMKSSGTSGQLVSKIYLDKETSKLQTITLSKIITSYIGSARIPMIIIDTPSVLKNRNMFSARGAGILGFSFFGKDKVFALNENMEVNLNALKLFIEKHKGSQILIFGFTFMIWEFFLKPLRRSKKHLNFKNSILIHGGGWKKIIDQKVSSKKFKSSLNDVCSINNIYDYYGMVEQTGSIFLECEEGYLHSSIFSDIIIRRHNDFSVASFNEKGIVQVISVLPLSYPGHSLLTEDQGVIVGEDDCPCGRKGKYFLILGRLENAEIRGCSDTYE